MLAAENASDRRNVRNTIVAIAALALVVIIGLAVLPLVSLRHEQFNDSFSVVSPQGFALTLRINGTQLIAGQGEMLTAWFNSTSSGVANITAAADWPIGPQGLWTRICTNGWPLGVGVMSGYFTAANYSLGTLARVPVPLTGCPITLSTPGFFLLEPHSSTAMVKLNGALTEWDLRTTLVLGGYLLSPQRGGIYTAIAVDEWGDIALTHFHVSQ